MPRPSRVNHQHFPGHAPRMLRNTRGELRWHGRTLGGGLLVSRTFSDFSEQLVSMLFLFEVFLKQARA
jgi:hypothetical protein